MSPHKPGFLSRRGLDLLNIAMSCLMAVVVVSTAVIYSSFFLESLLALAALVLLAVWLLVAVVALWRRSWRNWKLAVIPLVLAITIGLIAWSVPVRFRFVPSQGAFDDAVTTFSGRDDCVPISFGSKLGSYRPQSVTRSGGLTLFALNEEGWFEPEIGFAHIEGDLPSTSGVCNYDAIHFSSVGDNWYYYSAVTPWN